MAEITRFFDRRAIERAAVEDLSLNDFTPRLHLPNLRCLGLLADRILAAYLLFGRLQELSAQSGCQPLADEIACTSATCTGYLICLTHVPHVQDSSTGERLPEPSLTTQQHR